MTDQKAPYAGWRAAVGRIGWEHRYTFNQNGNVYANAMEAEINEADADWPPLGAGLFGGDPTRLDTAVKAYRVVVDSITEEWI